MYKRFKGSARNLIYAAALIIVIILLLISQFMLSMHLIIRVVSIVAIIVGLYSTIRFILCYTNGIRMTPHELRVARFKKSLIIPVQKIEQIHTDGLDLCIHMIDQTETRISLKDVNDIDRKVITSLIKYYRS